MELWNLKSLQEKAETLALSYKYLNELGYSSINGYVNEPVEKIISENNKGERIYILARPYIDNLGITFEYNKKAQESSDTLVIKFFVPLNENFTKNYKEKENIMIDIGKLFYP